MKENLLFLFNEKDCKEWEIFHHLLFPLVEELVVLLADLPGPLSTLLFQQERSRMLQDNINSQIGS